MEEARSQWPGQLLLRSYMTLNSPPSLVISKLSNVQEDRPQKTKVSPTLYSIEWHIVKFNFLLFYECCLYVFFCHPVMSLAVYSICVWNVMHSFLHTYYWGAFPQSLYSNSNHSVWSHCRLTVSCCKCKSISCFVVYVVLCFIPC